MLTLLRSKTARRQFVVLTLASCLLVLAAHIYLDSRLDSIGSKYHVWVEAGTQLTGGLFAGIVTSAFLVFLFSYLFPIETELALVECVDPAQTRAEHDQALDETSFWYHDGHIARWVRTEAVPHMGERARKDGTHKYIKVAILDPTDEASCSAYSQYRESIQYKEPGFATLEDTRAELFASILVLTAANSDTSGLQVEIYLKRGFAPSRLDIADHIAFRTLVNPRSPAILLRRRVHSARHGFYEAANVEFEAGLQACRRFNPGATVPSPNLLTVNSVAAFLYNEFQLQYGCDDRFVELVLEKARANFNPYS